MSAKFETKLLSLKSKCHYYFYFYIFGIIYYFLFEEKTRWLKVKKWNDLTHSLRDNDVIGFGDADEITSRKNIQLLKYCPLRSKSLDIGIWFPFGRIDQAFRSDFPVSKKYKYTLGKVYLLNTRRTKQVNFTSVC